MSLKNAIATSVQATTTIRITLAEVMDSLKLVSSYLGGKREGDAGGYSRVAAFDMDTPLVALLMEDAALLMAGAFPGPLRRWQYSGSALNFEIEGEHDAEGLHAAMQRVVSLEVLRRWLRISGSDYADTVSESAATAVESLKIFFRKQEDDEVAQAPEHLPKAKSRRLPPI